MTDEPRASLELLYTVGRDLTSDLDIHTVLERVLASSSKYVGAERASAIVLDEHQEPVEGAIIVHDRLVAHTLDQLRTILAQGLAGWVLRHREAALIPNTSLDDRWLRRPDDAAEKSGAKSALCVPVTTRDRVVGVLTLVHPIPNFFTQEHLALLRAIADQAAIAIFNARLYDSLQAAHRRYHELFEDSIDPVWITDFNGSVLEANRQSERMTGHLLGGLNTHAVSDLLALAPGWLDEQQQTLQSGDEVGLETQLFSHTGPAVPVEIHVRKVQTGSEPSLQWILRDLSERKALDALRDDLMAMIYHDLRSPLSNIVSSLDMLNMLLPPSDRDSLQAVLTIAARSAERMQRMINTLLDIYRLEAGQMVVNRRPIEVLPLVREAIDAVLPVIETKNQEMRIDVESNLPLLSGDVDMIRRVIINLLDNATKFTAYKGEVTALARRVGDEIEFSVQDNGPGIPPDALEQIFDKFARLQAERFPKGLGLGLAFCKLAVNAHGGRIWVESQVDAGSRFKFTLPIPSSGAAAGEITAPV
jgi:two-component system, NtrC family, sensor histidine kinase KinB